MNDFTIISAQINPVLGDIPDNIRKIREIYLRHRQRADLVIFTEMCATGYPAEDLVLKPAFVARARAEVEALAKEVDDQGAALVIGAPWTECSAVYNAALLLHAGKIAAVRYKRNLPNYGVFDEVRIFTPGPLPAPVEFRGMKLGLMTCEDMWFPEVTETLAKAGAEILIVPNGSPYEAGKTGQRADIARDRVQESGLPLVYVNQVGGQDELVFDGASFILDHTGRMLAQLPSHVEYESSSIWRRESGKMICKSCEATVAPFAPLEEIYQTLMLGLRDYVDKNGFPGVLLGMSGGIDSALSAAIAVDALGASRVQCFMMPSPYTSAESIGDAQACSDLLEIKHGSASISPVMAALDAMMKEASGKAAFGLAAENIQARARGVFLMAMSNTTGAMVLSTGNKSEMSVGYATLYGDMCGGYNVLKDVYKTTVFKLARWRNENHPKGAKGPQTRVIPERIITRPPSAELRPDQKDEDSLPPYSVLDDILQCLIEREMSAEETVTKGHDAATVARVWKMLDRAEYKRRQACPGVKITHKAFGRDRRYPITNRFTDIVTG